MLPLLQLSLVLLHAFQPLLFFLVFFSLFLFFLLGLQLQACVVTLPSVLALLHVFHSLLSRLLLPRPLPILLLGLPVWFKLLCLVLCTFSMCRVMYICTLYTYVHHSPSLTLF